ncbi:MAG: M23 family metallopeptidase [Peptococcaceae bacterium]|jgi:murein DD-endopeptidase MepM/ murein hydrolase activator NlpD|nr:M23 family metallopeptidase [Peptococcaceae bacterium]MDH7526069.1 M23 family metallopeptidase [Peptococcaceae bacterium]
MDSKKIAHILKAQSKSLKLLGVYLAVVLFAFSLAVPVINGRLKEQEALKAPQAATTAFEVKEAAGANEATGEKEKIAGTAAKKAAGPVTKDSPNAAPRSEGAVPAAGAVEPVSQNIDIHKMAWPLKGEVFRSVGLSYSQTFSDYRYHNGIDIRAKTGSEAVAVLAGKVVQVETTRGEAIKVVLDHGAGWRSIYAHLQEAFLKAGDSVKANESVGLVGQPGINEILEGPHLHYSLQKDGRFVNPLDYLPPQ